MASLTHAGQPSSQNVLVLPHSLSRPHVALPFIPQPGCRRRAANRGSLRDLRGGQGHAKRGGHKETRREAVERV